mmetsp:Transcript_8769/g.21666  ORF Transcript_8769/g.21666 Transcript_8769/m.21666 type:complete len:257 (-) Transcript_8769:5-775(-)
MSTQPACIMCVSSARLRRKGSMVINSTIVKTMHCRYLMPFDVLPEGSMTSGHRPSDFRVSSTSLSKTSESCLKSMILLNPLAKNKLTGNTGSFSSTASSLASSSSFFSSPSSGGGGSLPNSDSIFFVNSRCVRWLKGASLIMESPFASSMPASVVKSSFISRSLVRWGKSKSSSSRSLHLTSRRKPCTFPAFFSDFSFSDCWKSLSFNFARATFHSHSCTDVSYNFIFISEPSRSGSSSAILPVSPTSQKLTFCWR